jgi:hypothetical protein
MFDIPLLEPKRLTSNGVKKLVMEGVRLVKETRDELNLPLFNTIEQTAKRMKKGKFRAEQFSSRRLSQYVYVKAYGYFKAPSTIVLDEELPLEGEPYNQPMVGTTASYYCAVHEIIHADDYTNENRLIEETLGHIKHKHAGELDEASKVLAHHSRGRWGKNRREVNHTWAYQYVDSATHYRTYLVLRHKEFPKVDNVWVNLYNSIFSPRLFTTIENTKGINYTSALLSEQIGETCIVEIAKEHEEISRRRARSYTV